MKRVLAILIGVAVAASALAGEAAGVKLPDTATIEGKTLRLNGIGLRKKMLFKVYVAALYVETPSADAGTIIHSDQVKSITLHILRSLDGAQIGEAISDGFWRNSKEQMSELNDRLQKLIGMFPAVTTGDQSQLADLLVDVLDHRLELLGEFLVQLRLGPVFQFRALAEPQRFVEGDRLV